MRANSDKHLWQCTSRQRQLEWIAHALRSGMVVTDSGLWLGSVDRPEAAIAELRTSGMQIGTGWASESELFCGVQASLGGRRLPPLMKRPSASSKTSSRIGIDFVAVFATSPPGVSRPVRYGGHESTKCFVDSCILCS